MMPRKILQISNPPSKSVLAFLDLDLYQCVPGAKINAKFSQLSWYYAEKGVKKMHRCVFFTTCSAFNNRLYFGGPKYLKF